MAKIQNISEEQLQTQNEYAQKVKSILGAKYYDRTPKAYIHTYGCQGNVSDSERIMGMLKEMGYGFTEELSEADLVLYNTCAVREHAEDRVFGNVGILKKYKEENHDLVIALCGCMMQQQHIRDKIYKSYPYVDLVFGTHAVYMLPELLYNTLQGSKRVVCAPDKKGDIAENVPVYRDRGIKAWLPIMYGCDNFCSYCIVPYTRGRERSREPGSILNELHDLQAKGFKEVTLLGQNVNSYRYVSPDDGSVVDFASLLGLVADAAPQMRVRFTTSHPKDMSDEIIATIACHPNICNHIHLPVQSGSNTVLKAMNRKYTREWYLDRIAAIRRMIPDCGISTDMFTGFHGETEEDFEQTLSLMREVGFDSAFMFKYSERPGTFASKFLPDNISEDVKIDRLNRMIALMNELSLESNRRDVGKTFEILVEGYSKRSRSDMFGRTQQNKVVVFPAHDEKVGDFITVKVNSVSSATLLGERID